MSRALLGGADLTGASVTGLDLAGADLTGTLLKDFAGRDGLKGLDSAQNLDRARSG